MTWPQVLIAILCAVQCVRGTRALVRDKNMSSGTATLALFLFWGMQAVYVYVLHVGGFW